MTDKAGEWLKQAEYDIESAQYMFDGGRYSFSVFLCHLSVEKILKGVYQLKTGEVPPKTHNLVYFLNKLEIVPEKRMLKIIVKLNEANISTRYPENLDQIQKYYTKEITEIIIEDTREVLEWVKNMY